MCLWARLIPPKRLCVMKLSPIPSTKRLVWTSISLGFNAVLKEVWGSGPDCPGLDRWKDDWLMATVLLGVGLAGLGLVLMLWRAALHSSGLWKKPVSPKYTGSFALHWSPTLPGVEHAQASYKFTSYRPHPKQTAPLQRTEFPPSVTKYTKKMKGEDNPRETDSALPWTPSHI